MIIKAEQKYARQTPTRLRLVASLVKKMGVSEAMDQLGFLPKKAAGMLLKVFKQAVANAKHNANLSIQEVVIKDIVIGEGPRYKRFQPVSRGRAHAILKKTSHVKVLLESKQSTTKKPKKVTQQESPTKKKSGEK